MSPLTDKQFLAAVAAALGETIALVRRRGFHLEQANADEGQGSARSCSLRRAGDDDEDDAVDLAAFGLDGDSTDDSRLCRRPRRLIRRRRPAA
ncbi:MAG: hypothetical protein HQ464_01315 [Planctomycetes bacterium]|nr:hypothetical protein [Planctomycetota bacterium]